MTYLTKFSAPEILLLIEGNAAPYNKLLQYTMSHLLLADVLKVVEITKSPRPNDPIQTYQYVETGATFNGYNPKPYEMIFTDVFTDYPLGQVLLRNMVKAGMEAAISKLHFVKTIIHGPGMEGFFHQNMIQKLDGHFSFTPEGLQVRDSLAQEIAEIEVKLKNNQITEVEILALIGSNVYFINGFDFTLLQEKMVSIGENKVLTDPDTAGFGVDIGALFIFDAITDFFDSSCSSGCSSDSSGSSDSSYSSCSSCSSCSN